MEIERTAPVERAGRVRTRLFYFDYLRAALVILVVLHHVSLVHGASVEGFYYVEPPLTDPVAFRDLLVFALLNQGWFMGAFFLLAGYFTPGSYDRKGAGKFLLDRLVRLGIPLMLFYFVLNPLSRMGWWLMPASLTGISGSPTWQTYPDLLGLGPLWFVAMLLIFCAGYAGWRLLSGRREPRSAETSSPLRYVPVALFALGLALASYLWRSVVPIGQAVWEFPTLAYLPQYLSFFVLGAVAYRRDWLNSLTGWMGAIGLVAAVLAGVLLFPLAFSGQWFSLELTPEMTAAMGDGTWASGIYALWDSITAVGLSLGLVMLFRRYLGAAASFGRFLGRHSYAVFVFHIPIIVFLAYALRWLDLGSVAKFGVVSLVAVPVCFVVAYLIRKVPGVARVL